MVTGAASDVSTCTFSPSSIPEHSEGSEHGETPPIVAGTEADGLAHMRETFSGQGSDNTLAEFICGSWMSSRKSQYDVHGEIGQNGVGDSLYQEPRQL